MPDSKGSSDMKTDMALVIEIKAGDRQALGKLVNRHKKLAYATALGLEEVPRGARR